MQAGLSGKRTRCLSACSTASTITARSHRMSSAPELKPAPDPHRYKVFFQCCQAVERSVYVEAVCAKKMHSGDISRFLFALMHLLLGPCTQRGQ